MPDDGFVSITLKADGHENTIEYPMPEKLRVVVVINNQFTDSPNTTQIASGAGRSSAAGNNAAIDSSNTEQQQSVGADGEAVNTGMRGKQIEPHDKKGHKVDDDEIVFVINNQINLTGQDTDSSATQVGSGGGKFSAAGTNSAIESSNTKQQHSVGGAQGALALNRGMNNKQIEFYKKRRYK
ncbi:hypothetical protein CU633_16755 [Bacillus sp. V3-13]|nr:hypothetical protein CU633_16755 [Bacillus sp. V3-13]